jgi:cell division protein FtsQ
MSHPVVSARSARRFAARARARRLLTLRPLLVLTLLVVMGAGAAWVLLSSDLLTVRRVQVVGTQRVDSAAVRKLVGASVGDPLARVDTDALQADVASIPQVATAKVRRRWPDTLTVTITERAAAAFVRLPTGGSRLVDRRGVMFSAVRRPPKGLPEITADTETVDPLTLRTALDVLDVLPSAVRRRVDTVTARGPRSVVLTLGHRTVLWGGAEEPARKAAVLAALLQETKARIYDVSVPETPTTSGSLHG